jgi:hypothetical protein
LKPTRKAPEKVGAAVFALKFTCEKRKNGVKSTARNARTVF